MMRGSKVLALLSLIVFGAPLARAYEIAPDCLLIDANGENIKIGNSLASYYADDVGGGFVSYGMLDYPAGRNQLVLEHCPSTKRLTVLSDRSALADEPGSYNLISRQLEAYIESDEKFTLEQMAVGLNALGGMTSVRTTEKTSCACALQAEQRLGQGASQPEIVD
jgi:hypothetical protein